MGMVVRTNSMAINANRQLGINQTKVQRSLEKLSSGFKINRAGDDAAGLAISEKMKAQIKGLDQAAANSQDGISLVQTAEGALTETHDMLNRMVELATKSANGTIQNEVDREAIQTEVNALNSEITRISQATNFNGINLLDGSLGGGITATGNIGGQNVTGKTTAAVKFTATLAVTTTNKYFDLKFNDKDGNSVSLAAANVTVANGQDVLDALKAADADKYAKLMEAYDVSASGNNITFTAKVGGANGKVQAAQAAAAAGTAADIAGKTAGADGKVEISLGNAMAVGDTITVGGKTYTMAAAKDASKGEFNTAGDLKALIEADNSDFTVTAADLNAGTTITISSSKGGNGLTLQIGDTNDPYNKVTVSVGDMSAEGLGIAGLDVSNQDSAGAAIKTIKDAINTVSTNRSNLGALQNRLEHTINNLNVTSENMTAANSAIRDTDMAKEMMEYTKMNVLTQAAQAMLAQANQQPQAILQLLQ